VDTSYRPQLGNYNVYDTWTIEYERDGLDQDNAFGADQGFNGLDDNPGVNRGVDDATEREAPPPYSVPLRGFQVIVRVFQNSQQQTRQFTVNHDFTPE
jgi:hypothetical protein